MVEAVSIFCRHICRGVTAVRVGLWNARQGEGENVVPKSCRLLQPLSFSVSYLFATGIVRCYLLPFYAYTFFLTMFL